jgi:cytochrome bd-type quinol oxidase subunit 2
MGKQNIATDRNKAVPLSAIVRFSQMYLPLQCILFMLPPAPTSIDERETERKKELTPYSILISIPL